MIRNYDDAVTATLNLEFRNVGTTVHEAQRSVVLELSIVAPLHTYQTRRKNRETSIAANDDSPDSPGTYCPS